MHYGGVLADLVGAGVRISLVSMTLIQQPCPAEPILQAQVMKHLVKAHRRHPVILGNQAHRHKILALQYGVIVEGFGSHLRGEPLQHGVSFTLLLQILDERMFPLSVAEYTEASANASGAMASMFAGPFQDIMHMVVTALVILLSVVSLLFIIIGGFRIKRYISLAIWATLALALMLAGGIGTGAAPKEIFGIFERFSVFAATGFNAVLGIYLFRGFSKRITD